MAKSNKPIFWSLFAAGGTLAAFLAPVLTVLFLMVALGHPPTLLGYQPMLAFVGHWLGKLILFGTISLFLWHAAHRLRVTLHDFGLHRDALIAPLVYLVAAAATVLSAIYLLRI
jgi:fumarate reductase subunit D